SDGALIRAASAARAARQVQHLTQTFGQTLMLAAGIGAVYLGTRSALQGDVTFGALIALIALTWKVLAPVQLLYASAHQIAGHFRSGRQVDAFLGLPEERRRGPSRNPHRWFQGALRLEGVTHRYAALSDPALVGVGASIAAGELVVVCGRNGAGKSTFLKLLAGLHSPTGGAILIDGIDYRQIASDELRDAVNYVPQSADFFHGSVLQNFRLAKPTATMDEVAAALEALGLGPTVERLPDGLRTRLSEEVRRTLPAGTLQAMSVARGLLRKRALYLLDEPCSGLDRFHEAAFCDRLDTLRRTSTVVMVTDRPSHFALADRLIFLDRGRVVVNDTGPEAQRKVRALYSSMRKV
ncbi:MAG: ATP-binding cassette domain-containing protein, partial [Jannaschia sp.]